MSYFKPFRRKVGVITLLLACVLMVGWQRSNFNGDFIYLDLRKGDGIWEWVHSSKGGIFWQRTYGDQNFADLRTRIEFGSYVIPSAPYRRGNVTVSHSIYRRAIWGFEIAVFRPYNDPPRAVSVALNLPYWSILILMTLLSACLLLSKPHAKPQVPENQV